MEGGATVSPFQVMKLVDDVLDAKRYPDEWPWPDERAVWNRLEASPEACDAFGKTGRRSLAEHSHTLTLEDVEKAAQHLATSLYQPSRKN